MFLQWQLGKTTLDTGQYGPRRESVASVLDAVECRKRYVKNVVLLYATISRTIALNYSTHANVFIFFF